MKLIGMLDSPYVRRVAISAKCLGIPLEHESVSVFRNFEQFQQINPVVKAPTLVLADGEVLMDSTLIIDYLEALAAPGKSLIPNNLEQRLRSLRLIGLALAACEKNRCSFTTNAICGRRRFSTRPGWNGSKGNWLRHIRRWSGSCKKTAAEDRRFDCAGRDYPGGGLEFYQPGGAGSGRGRAVSADQRVYGVCRGA